MKICSFDVGIKNLAYCIIDKKDDGTFSIIDWKIIDIINFNSKCCFENCSKIGSFLVNGKNYCNKHKNLSLDIFTQQSPKKFKCSKCSHFSSLSFNDINYCKIHAKQLIKPTKINCYKQSLLLLCSSLFEKLDKIDFSCNEILIENQPSLKNPSIKTISIFLYSYFVFNKNKFNINNIKLIAPVNKLKINKSNTEKILSECKTKSEIYKKTKQLSYDYTINLISPTDKKLLLTSNKKDDLCDAFLQGYYYLFLV